ncbi:hypothetical protein LINPERPRIM_LOCUS39674 [Linum perenne]
MCWYLWMPQSTVCPKVIFARRKATSIWICRRIRLQKKL